LLASTRATQHRYADLAIVAILTAVVPLAIGLAARGVGWSTVGGRSRGDRRKRVACRACRIAAIRRQHHRARLRSVGARRPLGRRSWLLYA